MKRANKFVVSPTWQLMLRDMQIDPSEVLIHANLPADLFNREVAYLSPAKYFQLWRGIDRAAGEREVALLLAESFKAEAFDAPIFASFCSPNFNTAVKRLSNYKPLIGPMLLDVDQGKSATRLTIDCYGHEEGVPPSLAMAELVFFTQLIRLATREQVAPMSVSLPELPGELAPYKQYFGCEITLSPDVRIRFSAEDASRPFLTSNASMWEFFEGKLNQKLADLDVAASISDRVRAVLLEGLPSGENSAEFVADKLAMSKRTLQRKLADEAETFQSILVSVRADLADHYLEKSQMSLGEISFLLGFQESNSFIRAYRSWRGVSPGQYREQLH